MQPHGNQIYTHTQNPIVDTKRQGEKYIYHCQTIIKSQRKRRERKRRTKNYKAKNSKMATVGPYLSMITLNMNVLDSPIKRFRVAEWIKNKK